MANLSRDLALSALEKSSLTRCTRHTITDISILEQQFEEIRRLGYGVDREEYTNGVHCLASPLRDHAGSVVGAIGTSMSSAQFLAWDESRLAAQLKAVALHVSATLGTSNAASL
jgi:IclR family transcriptional regulator, acetate operon repressor